MLVVCLLTICDSAFLIMITGRWFGPCFIFHNIWDVILPIDFHIFQDGYCTTKLIRSHDGFRITHETIIFRQPRSIPWAGPGYLSIGAGVRRFGEDLQADDSGAPDDSTDGKCGNMWKFSRGQTPEIPGWEIFSADDWAVVLFLVGSSSFIIVIGILVGGLEPWNFMTFHIGKNHPNWLTFFGVETTNQVSNVCYSPTMLSSNDYATRILNTRAAHALAFRCH